VQANLFMDCSYCNEFPPPVSVPGTCFVAHSLPGPSHFSAWHRFCNMGDFFPAASTRQLKSLQIHATYRNLWTTPALNEVPPHLRGGEMHAAVPSAGHSQTRRPSPQIGFGGQSQGFTNRGPQRAFRKMSPHLAGGKFLAAFPSARHPRPRRSTD
jgi:hypothetical protein